MRCGTVYTETVVHAAPERFAAEAPYQVVIVDIDGGGRTTVRMEGARVAIGDRVTETTAGTFTKARAGARPESAVVQDPAAAPVIGSKASVARACSIKKI